MEACYRLGTELITKIDGKVRAAVFQVAYSRNLLKRSINHLYHIEVKANVNIWAEPGCPARSEQASNPVAAVNIFVNCSARAFRTRIVACYRIVLFQEDICITM